MDSEHLVNGGEDWNYIFVARDFDGNEDQPSEEDSDSDSDYIGEDKVTQSDIEDAQSFSRRAYSFRKSPPH